MAHLALYRSWRPRTFDEVVGQDYVVTALKQSVASGEIAHALLFTGTRGTGKTSLAKIFARAINCQNPQGGNPCNACEVCQGALDNSLLDILEIDAASNNSVDNIRQITDEVNFSPTLARYKVYIIDEVHMLSNAAFNALLKTLEEPPSHVVFILATTDPQRIPATILSRCQRYDFRRIGDKDMMKRLSEIAASEHIQLEDDALLTICQLADGALRDAISLLDQASSASETTVTRQTIQDLVGMVDDHFMGQMIASLIRGDAGTLLELVDRMVLQGEDIYRFAGDLTQYYRNILVVQTTRHPESLVRVPQATMAGLRQLAGAYSPKHVVQMIQFLASTMRDLKQSPNPRMLLEVALIQLLNTARISEEVKGTASLDALESSQATVDSEPAPARPSTSKPEPQIQEEAPQMAPPPMEAPESEAPLEEDSEPEPEPEPEHEPELKPEPEVGSVVAPESEPEPTPQPEPTPEPEAKPDDAHPSKPMPELKPFLERLSQQLITRYSNAEAALLLRHATASWEGTDLRLDFGEAQANIYHSFLKTDLRRDVVQSMREIDPEHESELIVHLVTEEEPGHPDGVDQTPEWVKQVAAAAKDLGIPFVTNT